MPLIDIESGNEITRIPYRDTFDLLRGRLTDAEFDAMVARMPPG